MARSRARRRARSRGPSWLLITLLALVLLCVIAGLVVLYFKAASDHQVLDADFCPAAGPVAQTLVLVDATDSLPEITQSQVLTLLGDLATNSPKGGLLEIRTLAPGAERTKTIFSLCNPGNGSDVSELTGNPQLAKQRWEAGFSAPLKLALQLSVRGDESKTSPIMAAVQQIAVDHLTASKSRDIATTLVMVSDMLENTVYFSNYKAGADFDQFSKSPAAARFATDLAGADAQIWLVRRPNESVPSLALVDFWKRWIEASHGNLVRAKNLEGMN